MTVGELVHLTGSLEAGVLLHQIGYWFGADRKWKTRTKIARRDVQWIAKSWEEWRAETGLTERQLRRALTCLRGKGYITTAVFKFNGNPVTHVHLHVARLSPTYEPTRTGSYETVCTAPSDSYTEVVAESTTTTTAVAAGAAEAMQDPEVKPVATAKEILKHLREKQDPTITKIGVNTLAILWKKRVGEKYGGFVKEFTGKERGQLKQFVEKAGDQAPQALDYALQHWGSFSFNVKEQYGLKVAPERPVVGFVLQYHDVLLQLIAKGPPKMPESAPACPKCHQTDGMVKHGTKWVCHHTHVLDATSSPMQSQKVAEGAPEPSPTPVSQDKVAEALAKFKKGKINDS